MCVELLRLLADRDQSVLSRLAYRIRKRLSRVRKARSAKSQDARSRSDNGPIYRGVHTLNTEMTDLQNGTHRRRHASDEQTIHAHPVPDESPDESPEESVDDTLLSVDSLLAMTPMINDIDLVGRACRHLFISHVKNQPSVHELFFPDHERDLHEGRLDPSWFDFDEFAALFVCQAITKVKDQYGIHALLDEDKVEELLMDCYTGPYWKKIGFSMYTMLFADLVCDKETRVPFRSYMEGDRVYWARKLYERVKDPQWQYSIVHPVVRGYANDRKYNRDMNLLLVKLHLLDPTQVFPAFNQLRKALPDLNMELVTTNYLGEPFDWRSILEPVENAISRAMLPSNAPRISFGDYEMYYGIQVTEFIMQLPREMGLWTGQYPDNKRTSRLRDRCQIM